MEEAIRKQVYFVFLTPLSLCLTYLCLYLSCHLSCFSLYLCPSRSFILRFCSVYSSVERARSLSLRESCPENTLSQTHTHTSKHSVSLSLFLFVCPVSRSRSSDTMLAHDVIKLAFFFGEIGSLSKKSKRK